MPGKNIYKHYLPESYYHVYNRGVNKQRIFLDDSDYVVFLGLLKRYLGRDVAKGSNGVPLTNLYGELELLAFCLMPNHFHLFIYQHDSDSMKTLLQSVGVSYAMYFNKKYVRVGPVFQQRYRASLVDNEAYFLHISRYIHLNPQRYKHWQWSSLPYYLDRQHADWVRPERVLKCFAGRRDYLSFLADHESRREELELLKSILAHA